jgi:hypothetical protein
MSSLFIQIEDNKIVRIMSGKQPDDDEKYLDVPEQFSGQVGNDLREFDEAWNLRPLEDRLSEGLIPDGDRYKAVNEELVRKAIDELVRDGIEPPPTGKILDRGTLRDMTRAELAEAGQITAEEAYRLDRVDELATLSEYLATTDWYVVRFVETGTTIPDEVGARRMAARERISEIRDKDEAFI